MRCHPGRVLLFRLGPVVLAVAASMTSGCGFVRFQIRLNPGAAVEAGLPVLTAGALPGLAQGGPAGGTTAGGFAAPIASPEGAGGNAPVTSLPPPVDVKAYAREITARFGLRGISGIGVTEEKLRRLEKVCARYPRDCVQGLEFVFEMDDKVLDKLDPESRPSSPPGSMLLGFYEPPKEVVDGNITPEPGWRPRITLTDPDANAVTLFHEVAHHVTLYVDTSFGAKLIEGLRYSRAPEPENPWRDDPDWKMYTDWVAPAVPRSSHPTEYARTDAREHIAELIALHLGPEDFAEEGQMLPGFVPPQQASALMTRRLGGS